MVREQTFLFVNNSDPLAYFGSFGLCFSLFESSELTANWAADVQPLSAALPFL